MNANILVNALSARLGADWSIHLDTQSATATLIHAGGLRFMVSTLAYDDRGVSSSIAEAVLDAVEDGMKGLVHVHVDKHTTETGTRWSVTVKKAP